MPGPRNLTFDQAHEIVYEQFFTGWGSTTPVARANKKFVPTLGTPYVEFQVVEMPSTFFTFGGPPNRVFGRKALGLVTICVPANTGPQQANQLASQARAIFEGKSFGPGVDVLEACSAQPLPKGGTDGWYKVVVKIPLTYYETK